MTPLVGGAPLVAAGLVAIPVATFLLECTLGAGWSAKPAAASRPIGARATVMIPAHNEEGAIGTTIEQLKRELGPDDSILVVADNCTDNTAEVARQCGAEAIERTHATERGKGYALAFGTAHIARQKALPDAVIVLDADCVFTTGSVAALITDCLARGRPVQSDYELVAPVNADPKTKLSTFAFRVKNALRSRGLDRLGLPRQLAGTGMAFPWALLRDAPNTRGWITEDLVLGLELALRGTPPYLCAGARVESEVAPSAEGRASQRQRWEHGHLSAMAKYVPLLLREGLVQRRIDLLALALDLAVPPLALLTTVVLGGCTLTLVSGSLGGGWVPLIVMSTEAVALLMGVGLAWNASGRNMLSLRDLADVPRYLAGKLPSYSRWFGGRGDRQWVRAERRQTG